MGLLNKLFSYSPSGAFSFQFFRRNELNGKSVLGARLTKEIYFLLAPEEYTMSEGYKVSVTKTIDGAWIDDFGNDFKKISLSGSLFSFYFGSPNTRTSGGVIADVVASGKKIAETFTGIAGIDEFFRLRWVLSRMRETTDYSQEDADILKRFPDLAGIKAFKNDLAKENIEKLTYKDYGIVYRDYDDNNQFEVIIDDFQFSRSKEDPFTVNYKLEMTATRQYASLSKTFGRLGKGIKETFKQTVSNFVDAVDVAYDIIDEIVTIPISFVTTVNSIKNQTLVVRDHAVQMARGIKNDWQTFVADAKGLEESTIIAIEELVNSTTQILITDLENDNADLDDNTMIIYNALLNIKTQMITAQGLGVYSSNSVSENLLFLDNAQVDDSEFSVESTDSDSNNIVEANLLHYTIKQGDNLLSLSNDFYNDITKSHVIGQMNNLVNSDFDDDTLVGVVIKIPYTNKGRTNSGTDNNLVYSRITDRSTPKERQTQTLGVDIKLPSDRGIIADSVGDIAIIYGEQTYNANVNDRLKFGQGSLSELHPYWGSIIDVGEVPTEFQLITILREIETQASNDPRTVYAYIKQEGLSIEKDTLKVQLVLKPITGSESIVTVNDIISGQFNPGA